MLILLKERKYLFKESIGVIILAQLFTKIKLYYLQEFTYTI